LKQRNDNLPRSANAVDYGIGFGDEINVFVLVVVVAVAIIHNFYLLIINVL